MAISIVRCSSFFLSFFTVVVQIGNSFGSTSTTTPKPGPCPQDWKLRGNYCYQYVQSGKIWFDAENDCIQKKGHLAWITSDAENKFVLKMVQDGGLKYYDIFIGAHRYCSQKPFRWSNQYQMTYTNWKGAPTLNDTKACALMTITNNSVPGEWIYSDCGVSQHYVCKAAKAGYIAPTPPTSSAPCEFGWCQLGHYCYKVFADQKVWQLAEESCVHNYNSDLVSIHSYVENNFTLGVINTLGTIAGSHQVWIGYEQLDSYDKQFRWVDNSPSDFTGWLPNQPDHHNLFGEESCVEIFDSLYSNATWRGWWNDQRCDAPRPYICKKYTKNHPGTPYPTHNPKPGGCRSGWMNYDGRCYKYMGREEKDHLTFSEANAICKNSGDKIRADLVSITSVYDQMIVQSMLINHNSSVWIGLYITGSRALWTDESVFSYENWDGTLTTSDGCAYMKGSSEVGLWPVGLWEDISRYKCDNLRLPYICAQYADPNIPTPTPPNDGCPNGFQRYGDACYSFQETNTDWDTAEQNCQKMAIDSFGTVTGQSHLTSINTPMELAFIASQAHVKHIQEFWIGLNDKKRQGDYAWVDGWPVFLTQWGPNQPNDNSGEDCVKMSLENEHTGSSWYTIKCAQHNPYLCKWDPNPAPTILVRGRCPLGWSEGTEKCFFISQDKAGSWADAQMACQQLGKDLASIHSKGEQDFLIRLDGILSASGRFWIGLVKASPGHGLGGYLWTDKSAANYLNWANGQPQEPSKDAEYGTTMDPKGFWYLTDIHDAKWGYICETPKLPFTTIKPGTSRSTLRPPTGTRLVSTSSTTTTRGNYTGPTQEAEKPSSGGISGGAIAGIVIGILLVIAVAGIVGFLLYTKPLIIFRRHPTRLTGGSASPMDNM